MDGKRFHHNGLWVAVTLAIVVTLYEPKRSIGDEGNAEDMKGNGRQHERGEKVSQVGLSIMRRRMFDLQSSSFNHQLSNGSMLVHLKVLTLRLRTISR